MKPVHKHLVAAACLAVLGFSASAQPAQPAIVAPGAAPTAAMPGPGQHPTMQEHFARMQQRMARRDAALKQITPDQEGAWNQWAAARHASADMPRPRPGEFAQLTTPQRIDRMRELRAARDAEMDRRAEATKAFYASLTPAQQKAFDALTLAHMGGFGGHRGHHEGGWSSRG